MRPAATVAAVAVLLSLSTCSDDEPAALATTTTAPTTTSTSASPPTAAVTSSTRPSAAEDQAVWPVPGSAQRFADPVAAVRSFARDYLGFSAPELGSYRAGEPGAGEVEIRRKPGPGPVTVASVRELRPGAWSVTSAASANLRLESPGPLDTIPRPVRLRGQSTAFEATINVGVREDGQRAGRFLGQDHTMGGANGEFGPFDTTLEYAPPRRRAGAVMVFVLSAEDGTIAEATVVRVRFS